MGKIPEPLFPFVLGLIGLAVSTGVLRKAILYFSKRRVVNNDILLVNNVSTRLEAAYLTETTLRDQIVELTEENLSLRFLVKLLIDWIKEIIPILDENNIKYRNIKKYLKYKEEEDKK